MLSTIKTVETSNRRRLHKVILISIVIFSMLSMIRFNLVSAHKITDEMNLQSLYFEMTVALTTLNYTGTFVHLLNGQVEVMNIVHAVDTTGVHERLSSLTGEARVVYRNNNLVTCIWPRSESILIFKTKRRGLQSPVEQISNAMEHYTISAASDDRVAETDAFVINVIPKDKFRYGYKLWIDKKSKMLLRSILIDNNNERMEEVIFTKISFPESISPREYTIDSTNSEYTLVDMSEPLLPDDAKTSRVAFSQLPNGYSVARENYLSTSTKGNPIDHIMLTDGIALVSAFIEYKRVSENIHVEGFSRIGATNAFSRKLGSGFITVIGEAPKDTVKLIADSIRLVDVSRN